MPRAAPSDLIAAIVVIGWVLDSASILLITVPLMLPVAKSFGSEFLPQTRTAMSHGTKSLRSSPLRGGVSREAGGQSRGQR